MRTPVVLLSAGTRRNKSGTGINKLIEQSKPFYCGPYALSDARVVAVVTDHRNGGVRKHAALHNIPVYVVPSSASKKRLAASYRELRAAAPKNAWFVFCGWTQWIGDHFPPERTLNVYRGARPGEPGLSYYHAHDIDAHHFLAGCTNALMSALAFNFVLGPYCDDGPVIVRFPVPVRVSTKDVAELFHGTGNNGKRSFEHRVARLIKQFVREAQHHYLPQVLEQALIGHIAWNESCPHEPVVPDGYRRLTATQADPRHSIG